MSAADEKLADHIFNGSLAIQAVLIAVVSIVAAGYEKIELLPEVEPKFRWFLWGLVALSFLGCVVSLLAIERVRGRSISPSVLIWLLRLLVVGAAAASSALVFVVVF